MDELYERFESYVFDDQKDIEREIYLVEEEIIKQINKIEEDFKFLDDDLLYLEFLKSKICS